jgi:acid phosphatase type 7
MFMRTLCIPPLLILALLNPGTANAESTVLYAIGDIADCSSKAHESVAALIAADRSRLPAGRASRLLLLGDLVYPDGSTRGFADCFDPVWGRFKPDVLAVPGNHDYYSANGAPFYAYFGSPAAPLGYFSLALDGWRVLGLNSNIAMDAKSAQGQWLSETLAGKRNACLLAMWHHPRYSSGPHGNTARTDDAWQALADAGASVVLAGHDHHYERFTAMNAKGEVSARGTRSFVVGTGGASPYPLQDRAAANSAARVANKHGVLRLELEPGQYRWQFLAAPDGEVLDAGESRCAAAPAP